MNAIRLVTLVAIVLIGRLAFAQPNPPVQADPPLADDVLKPRPETDEQVLARLKAALPGSDFVLVAKVQSFQLQAQTRSMPPSNMGQVSLADAEMLKGDQPESLSFRYSYVSGRGYAPAAGDRVLVVGKLLDLQIRRLGPNVPEAKLPPQVVVQFMHKTTPALLAAAKDATGKSPSSQPDDKSGDPASQPEPEPARLLGPPEPLRPVIVPDHLRINPPIQAEPAPLPPGDEMHKPGAVEGRPNPNRIRMDGGPIRIDGGPVRQPGDPQPAQPAKPDPKQQLVNAVTQGPLVFTGAVEKVVQGPMAMSEPPILTMFITFKDVTVIKGVQPENLNFSYRVTRGRGIEPAVDQKLLVVAEAPRPMPAQPRVQPGPNPAIRRLPIGAGGGGTTIRLLVEATDDNIALAKKAIKLPAGWSLDNDGKAVSPWAELGEKAWPKDIKYKPQAEVVGAKTGRPALLAGQGITLKVEQVIPAEVDKFKNPFGDGKFKLTVTNTTAKPLDVPALLTNSGKEILWADSVLVIERDKAHLLPGAGKLTADARPVRLEPGQSVSAEVDTLKLTGVSWPRGGSRVMFRFALGELAEENFFYYYSDRHDKMRAGGGNAVQDDVAANQAGWTKLFADEQWYKGQSSAEQEFVGTLQAVAVNEDMATTLQRTSYYRLGGRTIYTGAKKSPALDALVGKRVVIRGKPYDINLEGQAVSEIWPAAVRPATDADKDTKSPPPGAGVMKLDGNVIERAAHPRANIAG